MRLPKFVFSGLLLCLVCGQPAWAQAGSKNPSAQTKGIDPALLAKAKAGDAAAQNNLGLLYSHGQGVPQDYAEAYFWFDLAASGKLTGTDENGKAFEQKDADENRDRAAAHLSPAELVRVQERARKWFEAHPAQSEAP